MHISLAWNKRAKNSENSRTSPKHTFTVRSRPAVSFASGQRRPYVVAEQQQVSMATNRTGPVRDERTGRVACRRARKPPWYKRNRSSLWSPWKRDTLIVEVAHRTVLTNVRWEENIIFAKIRVVESASQGVGGVLGRSRIFLSDCGSPIGSFFITLLSREFLLKFSLETFIETENFCCAPRFPLIDSCNKIVDSQAKLY